MDLIVEGQAEVMDGWFRIAGIRSLSIGTGHVTRS